MIVEEELSGTHPTKLHGVSSFTRLDCNTCDENRPNRIYIIGEIHGNQSCGTTDYINAYEEYFKYNESKNKKYIDVLLEISNWVGMGKYPSDNSWIGQLKTKFHECLMYFNKPCYEFLRFHWTDPNMLHTIPWLNELWFVKRGTTWEELETNDMTQLLPQHLRTEDDLRKIIFEDDILNKQGERCSISLSVFAFASVPKRIFF